MKNITYIAKKILSHFLNNFPLNALTYVVYFVGASNVQKAGQILPAKYPRIYILHGIKNIISIFFSNVANVPSIKALTKKRIYPFLDKYCSVDHSHIFDVNQRW